MKKLTALIICSVFLACGGGTSGSSSTGGFVEKSIEGVFKDENGTPLAFATVEVVASGVTARTDENGRLAFIAPVTIGGNEFLLTAADGRRYLILDVVAADETTVVLQSLYPQESHLSYGRWEIRARVTGPECQEAFFNDGTVPQSPAEALERERQLDRQIKAFGYASTGSFQAFELEDGTRCQIEVDVFKNGAPVSGLGYTAVVNQCDPSGANTLVPFAEGLSDAQGRMSVPIVIEDGVFCGGEVQIPNWGDLELGALVSVGAFNR